MPHDVFISYSAKDQLLADEICDKLESTNVGCWISSRNIDSGQTYAGAITKAIRSTSVFLLILSSNSNSSSQILREIELATNVSKIVVPFKIEEFEMNPDLEFYLAGVHRLEVLDGDIEKSTEKLVEQIKKKIKIPIESSPEIVSDVSQGNGLPVDIKKSKPGDIVNFGKYEQDNDFTNGKENIAWCVLALENGVALLLSEKILDSLPYNEVYEGVTWETCTLRKWLNNDFYKSAFNSAEQAMIRTSNLANGNNPWKGTYGGNDTSDKLFLLSYSEVMNSAYNFITEANALDKMRRAQGSDYAKQKGLYCRDQGDFSEYSNWWLRSPGSNPLRAGVGDLDGSVFHHGNRVSSTAVGVRPALWVSV